MAPRKKRAYGISSWLTRAVLHELEGHVVPADALLKRRRLKRADILDPDGWVPLASHRAFYRDAIDASGDPLFQIKVGRRVPVHVTRIVGHRAAASGTLREAMESFGRFAELLVDGSDVGVRSTSRFDAVYAKRPVALRTSEDGPSFAKAILDFFAHATGQPLKATLIAMTGLPLVPPDALEAALDAPIKWNEDDFKIQFPPGTLKMPVLQSDPKLKNSLEVVARRELSSVDGSKAIPTSSRVRAVILKFGLGEAATVERVADVLRESRRTLQRRLDEEGYTFSQLREETIREAALKMLAREEAAVEEIAFSLGFSSRTAFHRAVRRWTGKTPGALRGKSAKPRKA